MQLKLPVLVLATILWAVSCAADDQPCLYLSSTEARQTIDLETVYRVVYEGEFARSSEGILATSYLSEDRLVRYLTMELASEHGRTTVVVHFQDKDDFTAGWETYRYAKPIYEDPDVEEHLEGSGCFVVRADQVVQGTPAAAKATVQSLREDIRLVLADHMPCELRFPSPP